jgi:predicted phosphate transport protein (TIGR00153 family)
MLRRLLPKERRYFALFEQQTEIIREGLALFCSMLRDGGERNAAVSRIKEIEHQADGVAHEIFRQLSNSFITPFDREDIQLLAQRLDDVIDLVEATAARMQIYDITDPPEEVIAMAEVLRRAFDRVADAIGKLEHRKHRDEILAVCVEVNSLENEGDTVLRRALERIFRPGADPLHVIKIKEIVENLEIAVDRCEDLADVLETILLKNA